MNTINPQSQMFISFLEQFNKIATSKDGGSSNPEIQMNDQVVGDTNSKMESKPEEVVSSKRQKLEPSVNPDEIELPDFE